MKLIISVSDTFFFLPSPVPHQTVPHLEVAKLNQLRQWNSVKNMETSETVKLPMKYIERCCVGGKISNGLIEIGETVIIFSRVQWWNKYYEELIFSYIKNIIVDVCKMLWGYKHYVSFQLLSMCICFKAPSNELVINISFNRSSL